MNSMTGGLDSLKEVEGRQGWILGSMPGSWGQD